ncbi:carbohydrate-binding module family 1 [Xylariaceae sp. FL0804]|nr:carbohydrate-binding module family 1 [Xylariaceae sp. FL0804]
MPSKQLLIAALSAAALAVPVVEERQSCAAVYGQCGGTGFTGSTCCASGSTCVASGDYYSQCMPGEASSSSASVQTATPTATDAATTTGASATTTGAASGNPFSGVAMWANDFYKSEVSASAVPTFGAKATQAAAVPNFMWLDSVSKVPQMASTMADISTANKGGASPPNAGLFVVYDLPDRDCSAAASNGEFSVADNGVANYKGYIDNITAIVKQYPDDQIILVIEPDSLANLVTNLNVAKCQEAESAYLTCVNYAITQLNQPNVAMYLDAGHAGWLGWSANLQPAATLFAQVYANASSPSSVRGLATNVANYNAWTIDTCPSYTQGNTNCDEEKYITALSPLLSSAGWDAHFITDTGRNGVQPTAQQAWGDWCNVKGTGFGVRPSADTGNDLLDAFVWVKPGGECDGTSNTSATRYDYHCGLSDALQPAPEAGSWFEAYFEQLYTNANPAFT